MLRSRPEGAWPRADRGGPGRRADGAGADLPLIPRLACCHTASRPCLVKSWIQKRFQTVLPNLMSRTGIDMWIIVARIQRRSGVPLDGAADDSVATADDPGLLQSRRRQAGRSDVDRPLRLRRALHAGTPTPNDGQYDGLRKLVEQKDPRAIGINESDAWNHADGLTANEKGG